MNNLKELITRNTTQKEIAKKLNMSPQTLSNYINNKTEPPIETLINIANFFNVSLDYLCDRPYNNQIGYVQDNRKATMKKIAELSDKHFDKVEAYVTALIDSENL